MPSANRLSVKQLYDELADLLALTFIEGHQGADRELTRDAPSELPYTERPRLLGPLNFNSANRIQLLGKAEVRFFGAPEDLEPSRFEYPLIDETELFIISDGQAPPAPILELSRAQNIPVLVSALSYSELHKQLRHKLTIRLATKEIIHGVMMDVHGTGVLITGEPSVGKSELALELVSRGHILVADDAPEFSRIAPETLECRCPIMLQDFLEVRGLGVLNIARMYGDAHTRKRKILRFIVHLNQITGNESHNTADEVVGDRIGEPDTEKVILDVAIPERTIPVAPGRNLAVLVEAAVRDHILRSGGYSATRDLINKQAKALQTT